jgi:histone H3/H4
VNIPRAAIKKLVKKRKGVSLTDSAASSISLILEKKASRIAKYALARAKRAGRETILKEDIEAYRLKYGD